MTFKQVCILTIFLLCFCKVRSHIGTTTSNLNPNTNQASAQFRSDCAQATQAIDLKINNVRARLLNGGDMWWDGSSKGKYIVPNVDPAFGLPEVSAIFAGSIWLGGVDPGGNLKVACQTYGTFAGKTDFLAWTPNGRWTHRT